jgi:GTP cyclohydrolase I
MERALNVNRKKMSKEKLELGFRMIVEGLGLDLGSPHLLNTPARAADAWYDELCRGLTGERPEITTFPSDVDEMVLLRLSVRPPSVAIHR